MKGVVIAGVASGVGKTTVATGLMAALAARGLRVQGFKVGPDYIDPTYHTQATGRPSRNLDTWLLPADTVRALFQRAMTTADVAVVEGVMGLYDGRHGARDQASTAEIARLLGLPVLLVLDASRQARSAAATVLGFQQFDPQVHLAGVILNRVASDRHLETLREAIESATGLPVVGALRREDTLAVPERYLGLVPRFENSAGREFLDTAAAAVSQGLDVPALLAIAERASPAHSADGPCDLDAEHVTRARLAVARDRAFGFYYADALDLLATLGVELVEFSPLVDETLPPECDGVYLGGGFPELFAAELAANTPLLQHLAAAARAGLPTYAECGGLMYISSAITDASGHRHPLAGIVPAEVTLHGARLTLGYREAVATRDSVLLHAGEAVRGHEFHYSRLERAESASAAYTIATRQPPEEGYASGNVLASYLHLHLAGAPHLAARFADACASWRARRVA